MLVPKKWIIATILVLLVISYSVFFSRDSEDKQQPVMIDHKISEGESSETISESEPSENHWVIDIKGEVHEPGVYQISQGDRVVDAVEHAGGLTDSADSQQVNLAELLYDEMIIVVPKKQSDNVLPTDVVEQEGKIRINQATAEELTVLQGIGAKRAQTIIDYREENGPFKSKDELLNISGIGEKTLEQIGDKLIVP